MPRRSLPHPILVLIGFLLLCLSVAGLAALITRPAMQGWYQSLRQPPGNPPRWVFPLVWVPLYLAMAVAAWRVWRSDRRPPRHRSLQLWGWQLFVNALWTPTFFGLHKTQAATAIMLFLCLLVSLMLRDFRRVDRTASLLMAPYLAWVCYATWLTAGIAWLNPA
jgi:benzodiazapine receptor